MIPYRTMPAIELGPLTLHTFGILVGLGIALGVTLVGREAKRRGWDEHEVTGLAMRVVVAGLVGARIAYVIGEWRTFADRPLSIVAVWDGGLLFFGGFLAAVIVLVLWLRRHPEIPRLLLADSFAVALAAGMAVGRLGCVAVGEHLGRPAASPWGVRFAGGKTIEPLDVGAVIHLPALYEALALALFATIGVAALRRAVTPGTVLAALLLTMGAVRFGLDFVRINDRRVAGLTAAQLASVALVFAGLALLQHRRAAVRALVSA